MRNLPPRDWRDDTLIAGQNCKLSDLSLYAEKPAIPHMGVELGMEYTEVRREKGLNVQGCSTNSRDSKKTTSPRANMVRGLSTLWSVIVGVP